MNVLDAVKTRRLIIDGAMGTMLQHTPGGRDVPPELWNIRDPARVEQVHFEYLEAGADVLTTNTFGVCPDKYPGWQDLAKGAFDACRRALGRYMRLTHADARSDATA